MSIIVSFFQEIEPADDIIRLLSAQAGEQVAAAGTPPKLLPINETC
jgi:hypothetical protein